MPNKKRHGASGANSSRNQKRAANASATPNSSISSRPPKSTSRPARTSNNHRVPGHAELDPGTPVSLILKKDQGSGIQVSGIIACVLTRSDHPRGVKVRLRDGRVGRVQKVVSTEDGLQGEAAVGGPDAGLGEDGETRGARPSGPESTGKGQQTRRERRAEQAQARKATKREESKSGGPAARAVSLADYAFGAVLGTGSAETASEEQWSSMQTRGYASDAVICPVCMDFQGDEDAVRHHVEEHYRSDGD